MNEKNRNLLLRVLSAAVLLPVTFWVAMVGGLPFILFCVAMAAVAAGELIWMFERRFGSIEIYGVAIAASIPVAFLLLAHHQGWMAVALAGATIGLLAVALARKEPLEETLRSVATVALSWFACGILAAFVLDLRARFGFGWLVLALVVTWGNDTFAYFVGRAVGTHKLYERISPGKTWEGYFGGVAGSLVGAFLVKFLLLPDLSLVVCAVIALGAAVLGPLGDLSESMIKRAAGVKDSGKIIPGHGGVLDRIDALLFVTPWVYAVALFTIGETW